MKMPLLFSVSKIYKNTFRDLSQMGEEREFLEMFVVIVLFLAGHFTVAFGLLVLVAMIAVKPLLAFFLFVFVVFPIYGTMEYFNQQPTESEKNKAFNQKVLDTSRQNPYD